LAPLLFPIRVLFAMFPAMTDPAARLRQRDLMGEKLEPDAKDR
jgi:hypothetical protein